MPLPLPDLEAGCAVITLQINVSGDTLGEIIVAPRLVAKMLRLVGEQVVPTVVKGKVEPTLRYLSVTQLIEESLQQYLFTVLDSQYPDGPDATVESLKVALKDAEDAARPVFLRRPKKVINSGPSPTDPTVR